MANEIVKKDNVEFLAKREVDRGDPQALAALDLAPKSLRDVRDMAVIIAESGLGPEAWRNPNAGVVMLITAMEMGLTIGQAWRGMYSVKGMPAMGSGLVLAMVRSHRDCEYFRVVEATRERATVATKRRTDPEPATVTYTIQQARDAGLLVKDNWKAHPEDMLVSKAVLRLARRVYQDILYGFASKEELEDEVLAAATSVSQIVDSVPEQPAKLPEPAPQKEEPAKPTRTRRSNKASPADPPPAAQAPAAQAPAAQAPAAQAPAAQAPAAQAPAAQAPAAQAPAAQAPAAADQPPAAPPASSEATPAQNSGETPEWERKMRSAKTIQELDDAAASASLDYNAPNDDCDRVYTETLNAISGGK